MENPGDNASSKGWQASCFCGATGLVCEVKPLGMLHCHCGQCRRLSGAAFSTWLSLPLAELQVHGQDALNQFQPTANGQRFFCRHCGGHLYTLDSRLPHIAGVPAGAWRGKDHDVPAASGHYFCSDAASWGQPLGLGLDGLPLFGGTGGFEALELPFTAARAAAEPD